MADETPKPKTLKVKIPKTWGRFIDRQGDEHAPGATVEIDEALALSNGFARRDTKTGKVELVPTKDLEESATPTTPTSPARTTTTPSEEEGGDLNSLTVTELRDRARAAGVQGYGNMTKDQLVRAIQEEED